MGNGNLVSKCIIIPIDDVTYYMQVLEGRLKQCQNLLYNFIFKNIYILYMSINTQWSRSNINTDAPRTC